jgi:hypothetical protein
MGGLIFKEIITHLFNKIIFSKVQYKNILFIYFIMLSLIVGRFLGFFFFLSTCLTFYCLTKMLFF